MRVQYVVTSSRLQGQLGDESEYFKAVGVWSKLT